MILKWYTQKANRIHPGELIFISFALTIAIGTLILVLPISTWSGHIDFIDALFTATSAVCVTGLNVVDTATTFSLFGQMAILALIQVGGLGIMTFSVAIFRLIGRQICYRERLTIQDVFTHTTGEDVYGLLRSIFLFTFITEGIGALLLFMHWLPKYPWPEALRLGVFHSVSAFCNAGFALFPNGMVDYQGSWLLNLTLCGLIILGGIGFPVVYDLYYTYLVPSKTRRKLLAQTKVVLLTTAILIVLGTLLFWLLEQDNILKGLPPHQVFLASLFQSVTTRTAGFNTVDIGSLTDSTLAMMIFLMFIGASPASCGGGVKTTTLAVVAMFAWSRFRHEKRVNLFKKSVPADIMTKSVVLLIISITLISLIFFMVLLSAPNNVEATFHQNNPFLVYLFETVSAFGTVGLSMGATPHLSFLGKFWIILMMLVGRVGVLTIAYVVVGSTASQGLEYAEENIMVG